jgi:hypothetical protein
MSRDAAVVLAAFSATSFTSLRRRSADAVSLLADEDAPMLNNRPNRPTISTLANICGSIRDMSRAVDLPVTQQ